MTNTSLADTSADGHAALDVPRQVEGPAAAGRRAGRRPSAVWEFFSELRTPSGKVHARCNFCARQCAGVAARMVRHIESKCPGAPEAAALALAEASRAAKRRRVLLAASSADGGGQSSPSELLAASLLAPAAEVPADHGAAMSGTPADRSLPALELTPRPAATPSAVGYTALEAAALHRHLVLACVLHDVPPAFVEDEALRRALAVARPGLPRLRADAARAAVLGELQREAQDCAAQAVAQAAGLTLVYRHRPAAGRPGVVLDQVVGVDDRRASMLLLEQERSADADADAEAQGCCLSAAALGAIVARLTAQLPAEVPVNLCADCGWLRFTALKTAALPAPSHEPSAVAPPEDVPSLAPLSEPAPPAQRPVALLGTCLLRQSLALRKALLSACAPLVDVLGQAALLAHSVVDNERVDGRLRKQLHAALAREPRGPAWDFHARLVKRVLALEQDVRAVTVAPAASQDAFWARLREADALLTPFSWACALSLVKSATAGQFVLLWLWALALANASPLVGAAGGEAEAPSARAGFADAVVQTIRSSCGDGHPLACLLLDPRTRGAGLSATGRRHAKSLVVRAAASLAPSVAEGESRGRLLSQLGHFVDRSAQFGDEVAWEMSVGRDPARFWDDFSADTAELTRVARGVLAFPAVAQDVDELLAAVGVDAPWGDSFAVRQIKHQFWKNGHNRGSSERQRHVGSREDSVLESHRELLARPAPGPALRGVGVHSEEAEQQLVLPPLVPADATAEVFVLEQIQQLALLDDALVDQPHPMATAEEQSALLPVALDWFALDEPAELEKAVARFLPGATL